MLTTMRTIMVSAPVLLALAALGWGGNTIAARLAVNELSPMFLVSARWLIVASIVLTLYHRQIIKTLYDLRRRWFWLIMMGFGLSGFNIMFYLAAYSTSAINLGLIQSTIPAVIMAMGLIVLRTPVTLLQLTGLIVAMGGAMVVISKGSLAVIISLTFNHGDLIMLVGCCCYAGYTLGLTRRPPVDSIIMMGVLAIFALLASLPFTIAEAVMGGFFFTGGESWLVLLYVAIVPSFLSQVWFMIGVDKIGSSKAGMFTNLVPVFSALLGVSILRETLGFYHLLSLGLVFTGLYIAQRR
ncbi:DMT family transporter [Alphaproteobacteria bacterium]|jgi:drug/metabolite transporter (DMT)-like permease|nr:DMT family transporter [Alphaproteobacteria bacterium]